MRKLIFLVMLFFILVPVINKAFASEYVLPYPGVMPGNRLYVFKEIKNFLDAYWYFGDINQFKYNLSLSDEYLVEAKILFEYEQFALALVSLEKSAKYYYKASEYIDSARKRKKEVINIENIYKSAGEKHKEVLIVLRDELPESFFWDPEYEEGRNLMIHEKINESIRKIRE